MSFVRDLTIIDNLQNEDLFINYLLPDIKKCEVFPAIRNNEIHFYYKGGRLFKYSSSGFTSHIKYAFVCLDSYKDGDIKESDLENVKPIKNFAEGYERIKEYCAKYNKGSESEYVSRLFKNYSYINQQPKDNIVLLDIEAAFSQDGSRFQDRFDIVLYNTKEYVIKIVEAKLYSNSELHLSKELTPQVIDQIDRYENKIEEQKSEIITAYTKYLEIVNDLFGLKLPTKCILDSKVGLLYFDFNNNDKNSAKFKQLENTLNNELCKLSPEHKVYAIGDTGGASLKKLF